ncbi:MAG: AlpA family phage regulatory protein [Pseudomonadota bacterium]
MALSLILRRCDEARAVFGVSTATYYEWISKGLMTPGVSIGVRSVAWPDHELQAIARARVAGLTDDEIKILVKDLMAGRAKLAEEVAA